MTYEASPEQKAVITHPPGSHARVIAVAGAGKTTTMVQRLKALHSQGISGAKIRVLVYNRLARVDFQNKMRQLGIGEWADKVHTFHSLAYALWKKAPATINPYSDWFLVGEDEGKWNQLARMAAEQAEEIEKLGPESIPPELLLGQLALWKGKGIDPKDADHPKDGLVCAYDQFEKLRKTRKWLSFDDLIWAAVRILQKAPETYCNKLDHLIVDEAQDTNSAAQALIQMLAGERADLMLVGDDDQTIYAWRGSSPEFLLQGHSSAKSWLHYPLSTSYRVMPQVAQMASHLLSHNPQARPKVLHAHQKEKGKFRFFQGEVKHSSNLQMVGALKHWHKEKGSFKGAVVLGRLFSQLTEFESQLLRHRIPYKVEGAPKVLQRLAPQILRSHYRLALQLFQKNADLEQDFRMCVNQPTRYLSRRWSDLCLQRYGLGTKTLLECLQTGANERTLSKRQSQSIRDWIYLLQFTVENLDRDASKVLNQLVQKMDLYGHLRDQWGTGPSGDDQVAALRATLAYAHHLNLTLREFFCHLQDLDLEEIPADHILLTTIHRTKGMEWDLVILPKCQEGLHPYLEGGLSPRAEKQSLIEERRLFYVAITRAKKELWLGCDPKQKLPSGGYWGDEPSRFLYEIQAEQIPLPAETQGSKTQSQS